MKPVGNHNVKLVLSGAHAIEALENGESELIGDFGSRGGGAAGIETDRFDPSLGSPPHTLHLASATDFGDEYPLFSEDILFTHRGVTDSLCDLVRADMTFFETESDGAVFSVGSIAWAGSLAHNGFEGKAANITGNVLTRFLDFEPFQVPPPVTSPRRLVRL